MVYDVCPILYFFRQIISWKKLILVHFDNKSVFQLVTPFSKILESSRAWIIFIMSFISSFEIIKVVVPEPSIFFWISAPIAEAAPVIPNKAKTTSAKGITAFINGPANILNNDPKNPPD